ncbi:sulfurtransferase-like selenium metabolism protein YedF [Thermodesulfatator atlanticus]|uniref:sulfurtransferase-like selenium metabolism protein YedF n=1 Tax=Thermodesulfatator atlanticus TaxID=501497 RepID=UPI0003B5419C|nr:sulfurtransferase-like selenium metabolism protein YedF [Thermodesulfatator atlanticus]
MKTIDCRGLPCPQPVINTKNALDEIGPGDKILVLVDNEAAVKNVSRFAEAQGHTCSITEKEGFWELEITKGEGPQKEVAISCGTGEAPVCVVLDAKVMGRGEEALGQVLMRAFLKTLKEATVKPQTIICYNSGVFLALEDSEVLADLKALEELGIEILVCGTCLDFYGVKERLAVGKVSNMFDIVEKLMSSRVVKP